MVVRPLIIGVLLGLAAASAVPAWAEDPVARTQPLKTEFFEDIVDGIGDVLGVLVGPPISSPSPYLNTPGAVLPENQPNAPAPEKAAAPVAVPVQPQAAAPIVVQSPVAAPALPPPVPAPVVKAVAPPPAPPPAVPAPPPPRPAAPVVAAPAAAPPPVAVAAPACAVRVAATATLEQMRRLPKCP